MNHPLRRGRHRVQANIQLFVAKEGEYWVAISPALRVTGYGKTESQALESFGVEMKMFIEEALDKGTIHKLFGMFAFKHIERIEILQLLPGCGAKIIE